MRDREYPDRDKEFRDRESTSKDELDALLDAALSTYADPAAPPNIAAQVLASVRERGRRCGQYKWLPWAIAVPAFAVLLMMVLVPMRHARNRGRESATTANPSSPFEQKETQANKTETLHEQPLQQAQTQPAPLAGMSVSRHENAPPSLQLQPTSDRTLPKQEVFPTPEPLSEEEQALVALVDRNPGNIAQSTAESRDQPIQPIRIDAIPIPPITISLNEPPASGGN